MAETNTYSHKDIQRYLEGRMSPQEMHVFERSLMDDPFLADAMDGFSTSNAGLAETHIADIENLVSEGREKTRIVPLPVKKTGWWRAAAVILILATGGLIAYSFLHQNAPQKITSLQTANQEATLSTDTVGTADYSLARSGRSASDNLALKRSSPVVLQNKATPPFAATATAADSTEIVMNAKKAEEVQQNDNALSAPLTNAAPSANNVIPGTSARNMNMAAPGKNEFKGKVIDENGQPVAGSIVVIANSKSSVVADKDGNFLIDAPDTVARVTVSNLGYRTETAAINSKVYSNNITLHEDSKMLSDVVATEISTKRKKLLSHGDSANAEPVGGWKNFDQYLNRQVDSLEADDEENYYGDDVVLEFSIDKRGQPVDIKVKEQKSKEAAQKAVEILTNGPKWNKKKDNKVKVTIPFKN